MKIFSTAESDAAPGTLGRHGSPALRTCVYYRDLILVLLAKEFKVRYKSTFMGYAWSLIHPLAFASVFFMLFNTIGKFHVRAYSLYLIAGLFPWQCIANAIPASNFYFLHNGSLIKKVRFHRATLVLAGVLNELIHFMVSIPVLAAFMIYYRQAPAPGWWLLLPTLMLIQLTMVLGITLAVATCNLFFRDLERLTAITMHLMFYLTPIIYPIDQLPQHWRCLLWANPFAALITCWQGLFYGGGVPLASLGIAALWSVLCLAAGGAIYKKTVWRFAEIV
jgi:lipopolysaccharide transport system permease protein